MGRYRRYFLFRFLHGWASGSNGLILQTIDGGKTWSRQESGIKIYLTKIIFVDDKKGWAIGGNIDPVGYHDSEDAMARGIVLSTSDGGVHWNVQWKKNDVALDSISCLDQKTVWVNGITGSTPLTLYTKNGGLTWIRLTGERSLKGTPWWLDKKNGWIRADERTFQITRDSGKTWKKVSVQLRTYPWHISDVFENVNNR